MTRTPQKLPLRILLVALGGEGGGVLMNWIVAAARAAGRDVQATSVPGVAQRTGSTSYYIEIAEHEASAVLNLVPMPGRVDIVVASELMEAARVMEAGYVSPALTTLVASTNRVYATAEKIALDDGRFEEERMVEAAKELAKSAHLLDLQAIATEHETYISATLFGALAGSGALPWPIDASRNVIGSNEAAAASRNGFDAAVAAVARAKTPASTRRKLSEVARISQFPQFSQFSEIFRDLPDELVDVLQNGHARLLDYQDEAYAKQFVERVERLISSAELEDQIQQHVLIEASRRLALWMAYEDIPRVADLKTRPERFARIRAESQMQSDQLLRVTEYLKPRVEEVADILPARLGSRVRARANAGKGLPFLGRGRYVRSNGVVGYWLLRLAAAARRWRRKSLRFQEEQAAIEEWLALLARSLPRSPSFAAALAELPRVRKGYSDTLQRGLLAYAKIMEVIVRPSVQGSLETQTSHRLRRAIAAAVADEQHIALDDLLGEMPTLRDVANEARLPPV